VPELASPARIPCAHEKRRAGHAGGLIEYETGFGGLGTSAARLIVGRQLSHTFEHRQSVLEGLLRRHRNPATILRRCGEDF
jgi:hypothetical protein